MNKLTANFIWGGKSKQRKYYLSKLSDISLPNNYGGWGLLDLRTFGKALLCKSLWRGIYGKGPWSNIIKKKYMANKNISYWYRLGRIGSTYESAISMSFRKVEAYFLRNLVWSLQSGNRIIIGIDPFLSGGKDIFFLEMLLNFFHRKGYFT